MLAHPGKTDYQDGHKCLKNCEEWDLYYDEYHLHDKDRNAIRMEGRKKPLRAPAAAKRAVVPEPAAQEAAAVPIPPSTEVQTAVIANKSSRGKGYSMPVEAGFVLTFYDVVLFSVAGLLLLALLFLRVKERKNNAS